LSKRHAYCSVAGKGRVVRSNRCPRKKVCGRAARTVYVNQRRLLVHLVSVVAVRDVAGKNSHLVSEAVVLDWLGVLGLKVELEEDVKDEEEEEEEGKECKEDASKAGECQEVQEPVVTPEVAEVLQEMRKKVPEVRDKLARLFVCTSLVRGQGGVQVEHGHARSLQSGLERYGLAKWKTYWCEDGHKEGWSEFPDIKGDRFFSSDLVATIANLDKDYHARPLLGMLKHSTMPRYATARALQVANKALLDDCI
jgi:hypothetical protein